MTPLEGAANVLASHTPMLTAHGVIVGCECGIEAGDQHYDWDSWRHHAADMLAAAGVLPTVQEWGVPNSAGTMIVGNTRHAVDHYHQTHDRPLSVRWATAWTPDKID